MIRGLYQLLVANVKPVGGIWPMLLPENPTLPARTYQIIGGSSEQTMDTAGFQKVRVQFDDFALTYDTADAGRSALRAFLEGYTGTLPDGTFIQNVEWIQSMDPPFDGEPRQFRCMCECYLYFTL